MSRGPPLTCTRSGAGEACGWQWKAAQLLSGLEAAQMKIEEDLLKAEESYRAHRKITHKMHEDKEKEHLLTAGSNLS